MTVFPAYAILKRVQDDRLFGCLVVWLFGCLVVWLFGCFGLVFLFSPSLWERAGVRVCPLGIFGYFWATHRDFVVFAGFWGSMTAFPAGKILKYSASTLPCMLPASATRGAASSG